MAIRVLCDCGVDITAEIPMLERKTRSLHWFEQHAPRCDVCAAAPAMRAGAETGAAVPDGRYRLPDRDRRG